MTKIDFLILSICVGDISKFVSFDSSTVISCNLSCFSYSKSVNNLGI